MKKWILVLLMGLGFAMPATAQIDNSRKNTIELLSSQVLVKTGETRSFFLPPSSYVHKIFIQAESGNSSDSYGQIVVNGDVKGTLYVPGRDPHYVVTVAEKANSVQLSVINNSIRVFSIKAVVSRVEGHIPSLPAPELRSEVARLSYKIIQIVNALEPYTNYRDYGLYLLPIRKVAAKAMAVGSVRGDASLYARLYYEDLLVSLDNAKPYLENTLEYDAAFDLALELMSATEELRRILL